MQFKLWLETEQPLRVAHVGWTGNNFDQDMKTKAFSWLKQEQWDQADRLGIPGQLDDVINLHQGRDFLKENHKYDLIILYHIYCSPSSSWYAKQVRQMDLKTQGMFATSDTHCEDGWRRRLAGSEAAIIIAYGQEYDDKDPTEIRGKYLGNIPGYMLEEQKGFTVWMKLS